MRFKLAIITGAALVLTGGTGAAYAVVGHSTVSPTVTGNVLPIDDNHSPTVRPTEPGDDRGGAVTAAASRTAEPGDDRGGAVTAAASRTAEPGDDRGGATPEPGDDRGGASGSASGGHGSDDSAARLTSAPAATGASSVSPDDRGGGPSSDGSGHH